MYPYKFAPHSQKNDTNHQGAIFNNPLKRSNLDVIQNANLAENTPHMGFDGGFSQSFSSRRLESNPLRNLPYPHHIPENKPLISATGTPSRTKEEPIENDLNSRTFATSNLPSTDYSKRFAKANTQEPDLNPSVGEDPDEYLNSWSARHRQLRNKCAEQRDYITDLESQLAAKNEENVTLSRNISRMDTVHKQAMEKHRDELGRAMKNHFALKSDIDNLKLSSESSSLFMSEAKVTLDSVATLRDQIQLRDLESLFDNDGRFILTAETRETVHELRSELSKTQQVADLLRDKLHTMAAELAAARTRVSELEESVTVDEDRSQLTTLQIRQSAEKMVELTRYLQEQQHESTQAMMEAYDAEQQLKQAQIRLEEAQSMLTSMKEEMTAGEEFREEQAAKLRTLRHTIDFQEGNVKSLEARARTADQELAQALNRNHELQCRLDSAKGLEKNLTQQVSQLLSKREESEEKLQSLQQLLAEVQASEIKRSSDMAKTVTERDVHFEKVISDARREVDMYREKYAECHVSLKVLQERSEDQCVTLAASKESIGELQECLHAAERQAMEMSSESRHEIHRLQEQNGVLKARLEHVDKMIEDKTASLLALQIEEGVLKALLETEKLSKNEALGKVLEANIKNESFLKELALKDGHIQELAKRLAAAEVPSTEREREVAALKVRITELEATEKRSADRATTISCRYENNDLNDDEKAFVALLIQKARAIHDREMVEKINEIKRRDNVIKQHEARITQLEIALAHRIYDKSSAKGTDQQSNSMTVDAPKPQEPSSDHQPETRGGGHEGPLTAATADGGLMNPSVSGPSSRSTGYSTFSKLCREDTDDIASFEDESLPVATGKRIMFAAEVEDSETLRPARRVKHGKGTGVERSDVDADQAAATSATVNKKKPSRRR